MKKHIFLFLFYMMFSIPSFCQNSLEKQSSVKEQDSRKNLKKLEGTFEVITMKNKKMFVVSNQNLLEIEKRRQETEEVFYELSSDVRIRIFPRSLINSPDFIPFKN